jgi:membrane protein YqaA with SNARE-associated domain
MLDAPRRLLHRLYDWTIHWAETPQSLAALFLIALIESSVFPIPPDVLLIAIVAARPMVWLSAAGVCAGGSLIGAAIGYAIGASFMSTVGEAIIEFYGAAAAWDQFVDLADVWGTWFLAAAAFTPIPFKVATIASGAIDLPFVPFLVVSLIGRAGRFLLVAGALRLFGASIRRTLEANFGLAAIAFFALLVGGFLVLRLL